MTTTYVKGRLYRLKIADLKPDPHQARVYMDPMAINELAASIARWGVLVPIQFRRDEEGNLVIVSGHRRCRAAAQAGLTEIYGTYTEGDARLQAFVENLQREDLLPIDEAEQMDALMRNYKFSQNQLADALGKSQAVISRTLSLNRLPEDIRNACRTNPEIPKGLLLSIARLRSEEAMRRKFERYMKSAAAQGRPQARPPRPGPERVLIMKVDEMTGTLRDLPWGDWTEDDRTDLANALVGLRRAAAGLLDAMGWVEEGEDEGEKAPVNLA